MSQTDSTTERETTEKAEPRSLEQLLLAGVGWASLTAEAIDEISDELARRVGVDPARMRGAVRDTLAGWRKELEAGSAGRRAEISDRMLAKLGLASREELDELALTVAQLDHRLRLLERGSGE
jgi:polyhydroxyalkanoate synthesis regulator phasin